MFNKKKKMIRELQLENSKISNENYQLKSSLDALNISYDLLEEKYKLVCKERDELKIKLDESKKKKQSNLDIIKDWNFDHYKEINTLDKEGLSKEYKEKIENFKADIEKDL